MKTFSLALAVSAVAHGATAAALLVVWSGPPPHEPPAVVMAELVFAEPAREATRPAGARPSSAEAAIEAMDAEIGPTESGGPFNRTASVASQSEPELASATSVSPPARADDAPVTVDAPAAEPMAKVTASQVPSLAAVAHRSDPSFSIEDARIGERAAAPSAKRDVAPVETPAETSIWTRTLPRSKPVLPTPPPKRPIADAARAPLPLPEAPAPGERASEPRRNGAGHQPSVNQVNNDRRQTAALNRRAGAATSTTQPIFADPSLGNPPPRYPAVARRRGYEGRVVLRVVVDANGAVEAIEVAESSGHRILDRAALRTVRAWRFVPARRDGAPVAASVAVPVRFTLRSAAAAAGR